MTTPKTRPPATGGISTYRYYLAGLALALAAVSAQADVIFSENFAGGLGQFQSQGRVYESSGSVSMRGGGFRDTWIQSGAVSTRGMDSLTLTYYRDLSRLDRGETLTAGYSLDGSSFTELEAVTDAAGNVTLELGDAAADQDRLYLRFEMDASSFFESARLGSILLEGSATGGGGNDDDDDGDDGGGSDDGSAGEPLPETDDFVTFESGHVRPMALSADGNRLYVANTPANRVEVFDVSGAAPRPLEAIAVGMEPVALALNGSNELWVVNHLSDSVSVVDVAASPAVVTDTLLVGDEPRDIVFAGADNQWAFITAAHRGQNAPFDPQLTTPGVGRADVWVFDAASTGESLGGEPVTILNMFGDTLRGLARSADGSKVYTAVFNSGNRSTVLTDDIGEGGIDKATPERAADGTEQPDTGLIVQFDGDNWVDGGDPVRGIEPRTWNDRVMLNLPDYDVFTIDTSGTEPRVSARTSGVGTTLFNLAVNPDNGRVYVSNQEALNLTRFEGPGLNSTTVRGNFVRSRITVVDDNEARPRHLNSHIDYSTDSGTASERERALAIPLQMAVSGDGEQLYLAAMGSGKLARISTGALEAGSYEPDAANQLVLSGGGPTGVVLDESRNRAFVTTRFDNGVSVVNLDGRMVETAHVTMDNPEPEHVVAGRRFLYDASHTSSRGDSSCAGCHVFGDMDHLSWDLGNPDAATSENPNEYNENIPQFGRVLSFHPMKGPMTTQSLRGLEGNGPLHWRGDRTGQNPEPGDTLEEAAFKEFNEAFVALVGRDSELSEEEMDSFTDFAMELTYPPNPIANLDNSLTPRQQEALEVYNTVNSDFIATCNGCHVLDPEQGMFGTDGTMAIEGNGVAEDMKIPHLRNMYQKVGMFAENTQEAGASHLGDQIRGFGFDNSGASGSIDVFLSAPVFALLGEERRGLVEELSLAFPSEMNPIVGQQVTLNPRNHDRSDVRTRLDLLIERARVVDPRPECDLVATSTVDGRAMGWVFNSNNRFVPGDRSLPALSRAGLLARTAEQGTPVTFTCTPPGSGVRTAMGETGA